MNKTHPKMIRPLLCLILALSWIVVPVRAHSVDPQNTARPKITALYLYNFLLFVDWPKGACSNSNTIKVAILNAPQVYDAMKPMSGKMVKGKKLAIFSFSSGQELVDSCQVLFVGGTETETVKDLLKRVKGKPVLTVGDMPGFMELGGMVSFKCPDDLRKREKERKRFIINLSAVQKSRLKIRSRLLRISDIVYDVKPVIRTKP